MITMASWKVHSSNHSRKTTAKSSVPLEETSSNNGVFASCVCYILELELGTQKLLSPNGSGDAISKAMEGQ